MDSPTTNDPTSKAVHLPVLIQSNKAAELRDQLAADRAVAPAAPTANTPTLHAPLPTSPPISGAIKKKLIEGKVIEALCKIYDPEIPLSIYELGLIYEINVADDAAVKIKMTLTAPACPVAGSLPGEVEKQIENIPEVKSADVELVWDPPWGRERMSEAAQLELGLL